MFTLLDNSEKIDKITVENDSVWKQIPLRDFGSKCISNEHNLCHDPKCASLCHQKKEKNTKHE